MRDRRSIETGRKTKRGSKALAVNVSRVGRNMVSVGAQEEKRSERRSERRSEKRDVTTRKSDMRIGGRIGWRNVRSGMMKESRMHTRKAERKVDMTTIDIDGAVVAY